MELSWPQHTSNSNSLLCWHCETSVNSSSNRTTCTRVLGVKLGTQCCFDALSETTQTLFPNIQMNDKVAPALNATQSIFSPALHIPDHLSETVITSTIKCSYSWTATAEIGFRYPRSWLGKWVSRIKWGEYDLARQSSIREMKGWWSDATRSIIPSLRDFDH
jgi:hypothetical protein